MEGNDMQKALDPVWKGASVYRESFLWLRRSGEEAEVSLLYPADKVLEVWDARLTTRYEEGRDYKLRDGRLVIPSSSRLPGMDWDEYYPKDFIEGHCFWKRGGGYIYFSEGPFFHTRQCVVSYTHSGSWDGPVPQGRLASLPHAAAKLREGRPFKVLFYGDSITTGANSSGITGVEPFCPDWCDMVMARLEERWPACSFSSVNTAVGGTTSGWGLEEAEGRAAAHEPDLAILAFGMNDGSGRIPADVYGANIRGIMDKIRERKPDCDFILVATTLPSREPLVRGCPRNSEDDLTAEDDIAFYGTQDDYLPALLVLESGEGAVVADMTTMHRCILEKKAFRDVTGNNVNHPNDFIARIYAQVLLAILEDGGRPA